MVLPESVIKLYPSRHVPIWKYLFIFNRGVLPRSVLLGDFVTVELNLIKYSLSSESNYWHDVMLYFEIYKIAVIS